MILQINNINHTAVVYYNNKLKMNEMKDDKH